MTPLADDKAHRDTGKWKKLQVIDFTSDAAQGNRVVNLEIFFAVHKLLR